MPQLSRALLAAEPKSKVKRSRAEMEQDKAAEVHAVVIERLCLSKEYYLKEITVCWGSHAQVSESLHREFKTLRLLARNLDAWRSFNNLPISGGTISLISSVAEVSRP